LIFHQIVIYAALCGERIVVANFCNATVGKHDDLVGILYRAEAMRRHDYSPSVIKLREVFHNFALVVGIERVGGLVKKYEIGIFIDCTGYQDALFLPLRKSYAVSTDYCIELRLMPSASACAYCSKYSME
jgi:hypothetical protein